MLKLVEERLEGDRVEVAHVVGGSAGSVGHLLEVRLAAEGGRSAADAGVSVVDGGDRYPARWASAMAART